MKSNLKIAAAQFNPASGDITENIKKHLQLISVAVNENADVIIFPELSLTGYEPEWARELAFIDSDPRWEPFSLIAQKHGITIIIGAPVKNGDDKPQIGLFIIQPSNPVSHYSKMHLHSGENEYFTAGSCEKVFQLDKHTLGLAICADTGIDSHASNTATAGASIYLASVLITGKGYIDDTIRLRNHAKSHGMVVIMANFCGLTGGWNTTGKSAIWDECGNLLIEAPENHACLVIAEIKKTGIDVQCIPVSIGS
ncbi:NAD+ synthase [Xenorhabdus mauleonii]|uniref:NAD+ synthase n=1 Tax=Xenorhabdus mauleonii TaxID=351675 RepID=A0A1I3J5G6_9GAMM|nr:carbon-nitrogen hydrolase family protein [Xenorhabdus mauleonii]PHM46100.1 NAD+ synthase [Xenorhabdus mauleonii]SFI55419.1 Predicted amidohydrolase [Xenorhabdus mauleonii]